MWFGDREAPLFGWHHRPSTGTERGSVILCPSLFREEIAAEHAFLQTARELAQRGFHAFRFSYEGTGDSSGAERGPLSVESVMASIDHAVTLGHQHSDGPLALVGMRMGALFAAHATARRYDVDALVLWDPCTTGRSFLRRQEALFALQGFSSAPKRSANVLGFEVADELVEDLRRLKLPDEPLTARALVLLRPDASAPSILCAASHGSEPQAPEQEQLVSGEQEALLEVSAVFRCVPKDGIAKVAAWLTRTMADLEKVTTGGAGRAPEPFEVDAFEWLSVPVSGSEGSFSIAERALSLGPAGLFAIESVGELPRAPSTPKPNDKPVIVLLTSGADSHIGPSRLWVVLARRWARLGHRCVRVDLSGWGESPTRDNQGEQVEWPEEAFDDVLELSASLVDDPRDVVLVGLCSGGYQALESAFELKPRGAIAINPRFHITPAEVRAGGSMSSRRRLARIRPPWRATLMAQLVSKIPATVAQTGGRVLRVSGSLLRRRSDSSWREELVDLGVAVYCLLGADEPDDVGSSLDLARASDLDDGWFEVDVIGELDHSLFRVDQHEEIIDRLSAQVERMAKRPLV